MRHLLAAGFCVLALAACGGGDESGGESGQSISGTMTMIGFSAQLEFDSTADWGDGCEGREGYDDIVGGAQVLVSDEAGTTIASSRLEPGEIVRAHDGIITCEWSFEIADVPEAKFYEIEVSRRGGLKYSKAEMEGLDWEVPFFLETS